MLSICLVFFFSSRRRHTILRRDWSSDVCSSDLVCGTVTFVLARGFSWQCGISGFASLTGLPITPQINSCADLPTQPTYTLRPGFPSPGPPIPLRPPIAHNELRWYRNVDLLSIDYAFRPRLRGRLTLGGFTVPRKPWVCGEQDSHLLYRYSFRHYHFLSVHVSSPSRFTHLERSPTPA